MNLSFHSKYLRSTTVVSLIFFALLITFNSHAQQRLFWCDSDLDQIKSSKLDGTDVQILAAENNPRYHIIDFSSNKIYWTDLGHLSIYRMNLDGSGKELFVSGLVNPQGIAMGANGTIYIVDADKISAYSAQGDFVNHIHENLTDPTDLIISNNMMYWGDREDHVIERSGIDGSSRMVVYNDVYRVNDIEINGLTNQIYWNQVGGGTSASGIHKSQLGTLNTELVIEKSGIVGFTIDKNNEYLYWGDYVFNKIHRTNLNDLSDEIRLVNEYLWSPHSIILDESNNTIHYLSPQYADFIFKANLDDGSNIETLLTSEIYNPTQLEIDTINNKIYWIGEHSSFQDDESSSISRINIDGTGYEKLVGDPIIDRAGSLALDLAEGKMYWTDRADDDIKKANLDGTQIESIISDNLTSPKGISIDVVNRKLYWADYGTDKIQRSNLDGTVVEDIIITTDAEFIVEIAVSPTQSKIYWSDIGLGTFNRADLNGDNKEVIITLDATSANNPNAIHLDEIGQKMYYSIDFDDEKIQRSNFDGSEIEDIIITNGETPEDLFIVQNFYTDNDNDGFTSDVDCDDDNPLINPDAVEIANNMIDEDCDGEDLTSSLNDLAAMNINIYPTIFNRNIFIESKEIKEIELFVIDINGTIISKKDINSSLEEIQLEHLSAGIYFIKLISIADGLNLVVKIVKI